MITTKIIGNKIAEARKKMNMSQAQLAEHLFISSQAVGKWERGESMPDIITLNRLTEILGVDLNYFSENIQQAFSDPESAHTIEVNATNAKEPSSGKQKPNWDMSRGNWAEADFSGLKNLKDKFSSSNMKNCKFNGSEMTGLLLKNNNVDSCDFSGSDISNSHIQRSNLGNNLLNSCSLKEAELSESNIYGCDFSGSDFTGATFKTCNFMNNVMTDALWNRTSFIGMQFDETIFDGSMEDCYFENCAFYRVTFRNATLTNTFFKNNKNLKRIKFIDCKADRMTCEFLKNGKADLSGITLLKPNTENE